MGKLEESESHSYLPHKSSRAVRRLDHVGVILCALTSPLGLSGLLVALLAAQEHRDQIVGWSVVLLFACAGVLVLRSLSSERQVRGIGGWLILPAIITGFAPLLMARAGYQIFVEMQNEADLTLDQKIFLISALTVNLVLLAG